MLRAFAELPTNSAILDGELCLIDPHQMRTRWRVEGGIPGLRFAASG
jgi:hypothetical protein